MIKQIDKYRKHCLWRGFDINSKKPPKAAWKLVCNSKENGGLGVHDLQIQNESLLLKYLHKFFNKYDIPWVQLIWNSHYNNETIPVNNRNGSFWWRDVFKLLDSFKGMASVTIGDGSIFLFGQMFGMVFISMFSGLICFPLLKMLILLYKIFWMLMINLSFFLSLYPLKPMINTSR